MVDIQATLQRSRAFLREYYQKLLDDIALQYQDTDLPEAVINEIATYKDKIGENSK